MDEWLPSPKRSPEHRNKGSLSHHSSHLPGCRFKRGEGINQSDKEEIHLNEGEVTVNDSVLLPGVINLSSVGLEWREKGKG